MERPDLDLSTRKAMLENLEHIDAYRKKFQEENSVLSAKLLKHRQMTIDECIREAEKDDAA